MSMKQYETFELRFGGEALPDAWAQIDLTATFSCAQESLTVKGFYDGESDGRGVYVVRFLPQYAGVYRYQVRGAVTAEGEIVCEASSPEAHGIVRAVGTHFAFANGAPYIPFGTTVYALISQDDALVEQTLQSLAAAPFNKLRLCVFPKDYDYNHNEPPLYAFARREDGSWDTSRPSIAFYQRLERILRRIAALGIQLDLILFHPYDRWGFAAMPQADNFRYLDYLLRRLSAMPEIWWSLANEYDLCMPKKTLADWEALEAFVASCDPYHHLLSCHNCFCFWDFKRKDVTHASIQTRALTEIPRYLREYGKPVVIDECCYEGDLPHIWGSISGQEMVRRFWRCYVGGGAVAMIGLVCASADSRQLTKDLFAWYCSTNLPIYQPEAAAPVQTVAPSVNCIDSITKFMTAANVERGDIIRKRRCGGLSGDVARRTVELLNAHFGFAELPVASPVAEEETLAPNEYIGEAQSFGGTLKVKVTMDGDKIAKIDILSHGDTAGVCNAAYDTVPGKIIDAQSTNVDAATGATVSSKAIMAAVEDALSKVGK